MSETLVNVENVSKKFCRRLRRSLWYGLCDLGSELIGRNNNHSSLRKEEFWAVKKVSFQLRRGETLGLIGPNGAGKTTLLRMINGLINLDKGRIVVRGQMQALIALGAGFNPILTGRENIYVNASVLGLRKSEVDREFDEIVHFAELEEFVDTPVQSYSSGMLVRLGFAVAAHLSPDILLVDEVLAVGDEGFQSKCLNKIGQLKKSGTAIILVSHNMHTISTFTNKVILMNNGQDEHYDNVSEGITNYRKLFYAEENADIQRVLNGNDKISFFEVEIDKRTLIPGESFSIDLKYDSDINYPKVEIDVGIYSSREPFFHFQATNKAYNKNITLYKGKHKLKLTIQEIRINQATATIVIAIWAKNRTEKLFWWRIPVEFQGVPHSTGNSFLNVLFENNRS